MDNITINMLKGLLHALTDALIIVHNDYTSGNIADVEAELNALHEWTNRIIGMCASVPECAAWGRFSRFEKELTMLQHRVYFERTQIETIAGIRYETYSHLHLRCQAVLGGFL